MVSEVVVYDEQACLLATVVVIDLVTQSPSI